MSTFIQGIGGNKRESKVNEKCFWDLDPHYVGGERDAIFLTNIRTITV
jgi:hypothetical protein